MIESPGTDVEDADVKIGKFGESKAQERVCQPERLQGLKRIVIEAVVFVGEIQTWSDDGGPPHRSQHAALLQFGERAFDSPVRPEVCIDRQTPVLINLCGDR